MNLNLERQLSLAGKSFPPNHFLKPTKTFIDFDHANNGYVMSYFWETYDFSGHMNLFLAWIPLLVNDARTIPYELCRKI